MTRLPNIVSARLAALDRSEHPDADLLTAFAEHKLGTSERDRVLNHTSGCAQCRQILDLTLPESPTEGISAPIAAPTIWLRNPVFRWAALAACVIAVAATFVIQRHEQSHNEIQVALQQAPPSRTSSKSIPMASMPQSGVSKPDTKAKAKDRRSPTLNAETGAEELASARPPTRVANAPSANAATSDVQRQRSENVEVAAAATNVESASREKADYALAAGKSAAPAKSGPVFTARPSTETAASTIGGAAKLTDFHAPEWRLSQDGLPERSFAAGQWEQVQVDHKAGFHAITARDMEVWIGGTGGLLYHSEDVGLHWTRIIAVSRNANLKGDITGIDFTDHMHGRVHTADGQTWVTSNAGETWEIEQP